MSDSGEVLPVEVSVEKDRESIIDIRPPKDETIGGPGSYPGRRGRPPGKRKPKVVTYSARSGYGKANDPTLNPKGAYDDSRVVGDPEVGNHMALSDVAKEFSILRARGFGPEQAIREMDRVRGVERTGYQAKQTADRLEEQTQLYQLTVMGVDALTDPQWRSMKAGILMNVAQRPGPNAGSSLRAIEVIDKQRWMEKFGTREAVTKTLAESQERMKRLEEAGQWAEKHGVTGVGSDVEQHAEREGALDRNP